jgi:hypothetical protein
VNVETAEISARFRAIPFFNCNLTSQAAIAGIL